MKYLLYGSIGGVGLSLIVFFSAASYFSNEAALLILLALSVLLCLPLIIKALMKNQVPRPGLFGSRAPGTLTTVETKKKRHTFTEIAYRCWRRYRYFTYFSYQCFIYYVVKEPPEKHIVSIRTFTRRIKK
ncbi:hypothetical protein [Sinobaca sp. H24]|uniref:hypothetical protein n=1 Tax=Sinobaca sp. H24 TaxID=2923376 RepID=UPI00207AF524|nr:hypothetical protein [Sinobaca sp. H24]